MDVRRSCIASIISTRVPCCQQSWCRFGQCWTIPWHRKSVLEWVLRLLEIVRRWWSQLPFSFFSSSSSFLSALVAAATDVEESSVNFAPSRKLLEFLLVVAKKRRNLGCNKLKKCSMIKVDFFGKSLKVFFWLLKLRFPPLWGTFLCNYSKQCQPCIYWYFHESIP